MICFTISFQDTYILYFITQRPNLYSRPKVRRIRVRFSIGETTDTSILFVIYADCIS